MLGAAPPRPSRYRGAPCRRCQRGPRRSEVRSSAARHGRPVLARRSAAYAGTWSRRPRRRGGNAVARQAAVPASSRASSAPKSPSVTTGGRPQQARRGPALGRTHLGRMRARGAATPSPRRLPWPAGPTACFWRFAGPMPRPGRDLQRSSRGHDRGRESNGCLCPVGVAMAEVGDDETVTRLFARNDRPERPSIGRLCLCTAPRIATMSLVAGSAASRPYSSESPPSFRDEQAAHSPLFGQSQSGAISRETASMTASLLVVRSGAVVALNSGFSVAQALAIDWTRTRIAVASHRSVNLPSL